MKALASPQRIQRLVWKRHLCWTQGTSYHPEEKEEQPQGWQSEQVQDMEGVASVEAAVESFACTKHCWGWRGTEDLQCQSKELGLYPTAGFERG